MWSFIDCLTTNELIRLCEYQWANHGLRLEGVDKKQPPITYTPHYPDEIEAGESMREVVGEISPNYTRGI